MKLRQALAAAAADPVALEQLANRGLLRRAQRDLEQAAPQLVSEDKDRVVLLVESWEVCLQLPLGSSSCTCPAPSMCRHILTGILSQAEAGAAPPLPFAPETVLALDRAELRAWAGGRLWSTAQEWLSDPFEVTWDETGTICLWPRHLECHWLSGGTLADMTCSCHAASPCAHRLAVLLALRIEAGLEPKPRVAARSESGGAVRSRSQVLESVGLALASLFNQGLSRASEGWRERLDALAVSARGVDLPRMERALRGLSGELSLLLKRDARSQTTRLVWSAARLEALRRALLGREPDAELVGAFRTRFLPVPGRLRLLGLGARRFRSPGGALGLTLYALGPRGQVYSWTEARRSEADGFDPLHCYRGQGVWGGHPPRELCRSEIWLSQAWVDPARRISGRSASRAQVLGPSAWPELQAAARRDLPELETLGGELRFPGLRAPNLNDQVVLLEPERWSQPEFEAGTQTLRGTWWDAYGATLPWRLPYHEFSAEGLAWWERYPPNSGLVLAALECIEGLVQAEPITVLQAGQRVNLSLDLSEGGGEGTAPPAALGSEEDPDEPDEAPDLPPDSATGLGRVLRRLLREWEGLAESGVRSAHAVDDLDRLLGLCRELGLARLERTGRAVLRDRTDPQAGLGLLRAYYCGALASSLEAAI